MKDFLLFVAQEITKNKDIDIKEEEVNGIQIFTIKAPKEMMGMLIGKEGKTIRSIRALARAKAIIEKINISVQLEEK